MQQQKKENSALPATGRAHGLAGWRQTVAKWRQAMAPNCLGQAMAPLRLWSAMAWRDKGNIRKRNKRCFFIS